MIVFDILGALVGAFIVLAVLYDVFQTVVLPRWASRTGRVGPFVIRATWRVWLKVAWWMRDSDKREDFLGSFAPFSLVVVLATWLLSSIFGYGLMLHAMRGGVKPQLQTWSDAFYAAGTSLLTIGFGDFVATSTPARMVMLSAGASGLTIVALVISWTFTLYTSFNKREVMVVMLDQRAGAPPSGVTLLETYAKMGIRERLPSLFEKWEEWAAEVLESHIAYPILPFFRSSHDNEAWISALGAVLDAATLLNTTVDEPGCGYAKLTREMGTHTLLDISNYYGITRVDGAGVERAEWNEARDRLGKAGYTLRDETESWRRFQDVRANYAPNLNALARFLATPPTQWINDRSTLKHSASRERTSQTLKNQQAAPPLESSGEKPTPSPGETFQRGLETAGK